MKNEGSELNFVVGAHPPRLVSDTKAPLMSNSQGLRHIRLVPDLVGTSQMPHVLMMEAFHNPIWV